MKVTKDIYLAREWLLQNEIIGFPTETVYGLAGNTFSIEAVKKIFALKKRPMNHPLIVHTHSVEFIKENICSDFNHIACTLAESFWPGAMTLVLPKSQNIPKEVTGGLETVGVRIPSHPLSLELLKILPFPLAAPSANMFSYLSSTSVEHVCKNLPNLRYTLDGGRCRVGIESTIIQVSKNAITILRQGSIGISEIQKVVGKNLPIYIYKGNQILTAGMSKKHYSIKTPLVVGNINELLLRYARQKVAILTFQHFFEEVDKQYQRRLSSKGDIHEAAFSLYQNLYELDQQNCEVVLSTYLPNDTALARAINDRLRRASYTINENSNN